MSRNVFISYSLHDGFITAESLRDIRRDIALYCNQTTYIDILDNKYGVDYQSRVMFELSNSDYFVMLVSPSAPYSKWVHAEYERAQQLLKPMILIPVHYHFDSALNARTLFPHLIRCDSVLRRIIAWRICRAVYAALDRQTLSSRLTRNRMFDGTPFATSQG